MAPIVFRARSTSALCLKPLAIGAVLTEETAAQSDFSVLKPQSICSYRLLAERDIILRMDKGAHFYKCDFQVHTPRDANWKGPVAVAPGERKAYAETLIQACRAKGLGAIAITDHHDFAFFPYIKAAAAAEVDATGKPIPQADRLVVFPGLELTLSSPPCQSILLLDADFDETKFRAPRIMASRAGL